MSLGKPMIPLSLALAVSVGTQVGHADANEPGEYARAYVAAGDSQDLERLEPLLHPSFRVLFVTKGKPGESALNRAQYLELVRTKKLGGDKRKVEIVSEEIQDRMAFVRLHLEGKQASFDTLQTLVQVGDRWQLVNDDVVFTPKT